MEAQEWVTIAMLGKPRGNKGELRAVPLSDVPGRFEALKRVFLFRPLQSGATHAEESVGERHIENAWWHGNGADRQLILRFAGVDSIAAAEALQGCEVRVPFAERAPLPAGEFYQSDLIGCELIDRAGQPLGRVTGWEEYGGPGLMEIESRWLVPYTPAICREVDVARRQILVDLPEGLRELNEP